MNTTITEKLIELTSNGQLSHKLKQVQAIQHQREELDKKEEQLEKDIARLVPNHLRNVFGGVEQGHRKSRVNRDTAVHTIEKSLKGGEGFTIRELAKRSDASIATVGQILHDELKGKIHTEGLRPKVYSLKN